MVTTVSVPGRVILGGDLSPVLGGPELVAAVDTRLRVTVEKHDGDTLKIESPFMDSTIPIEKLQGTDTDKQRMTIAKGGRKVPAFMLLKRSFEQLDWEPSTGIRIHIDADRGFEMGTGLGSSTALSVGLVAALGSAADLDITPVEVADLVADMETAMYGDARVADAHVLARGGAILADSDIERTAYETDIVIDTSTTRPERARIQERIVRNRRLLDDLFGKTQELMEVATREMWKTIESDGKRTRPLLTYLGDLLETLGGASTPVAETRVSVLSRFDDIGCKQSDFGGRATLLTVPAEDSMDAVVSTYRQTPSEPLVTSTSTRGLEYEG